MKPQLLAAGGTPPALLAVLAWSKSHTIKNPAAFRHRGPLRGPKAYHPRRGDRGQKKKGSRLTFTVAVTHKRHRLQKIKKSMDSTITAGYPSPPSTIATVYPLLPFTHCRHPPLAAVYLSVPSRDYGLGDQNQKRPPPCVLASYHHNRHHRRHHHNRHAHTHARTRTHALSRTLARTLPRTHARWLNGQPM